MFDVERCARMIGCAVGLPRCDQHFRAAAADAEILALRHHQVMVLERRLHGGKAPLTQADRAWLAALLHQLPRNVLRNLRLLVRPETVLRWHRT